VDKRKRVENNEVNSLNADEMLSTRDKFPVMDALEINLKKRSIIYNSAARRLTFWLIYKSQKNSCVKV
jgi:hypothetical protein